MSTTTAPGHLDISSTERVPFTRLVKVEMRKMLDTRSGFWLLVVTAALLVAISVLVLLIVALSDESGPTASDWSDTLSLPLRLLLPVFAILTVTSEWSQRSGLVTFALEPNRFRVMTAKFTSVVIFAVAAILLAVVLGAIGNVLGGAIGGYDAEWNFGLRPLLMAVIAQVIYFVMAFGLGTVFLNTPGSIAVFYAMGLFVPLAVYLPLYFNFGWAEDLIPWIDLQFGTGPFLDPDGGDPLKAVDYGRLVSSVGLWIVAPLAVGARRILTSEPK